MTTENWNDKKFVIKKVKQNGCALEYAGEELRNDLQVAVEAINEEWGAFKHASPETQKVIKELLVNFVSNKK